MSTKIAIFHGKTVRRLLHENEWWFSVVDVCTVLTNSPDGGAYWRKLKQRLSEEGSEVVTFCHGLKLEAPDGKKYNTDCANTEGIFRIIQSIPSPKAEPLKRWLARVGKERIDEIENSEIAMTRMQKLYEQKGYSKSWIDKRLRGIAVRQDLTDEWKNRGADSQLEYAILTNEIMQGTFGMKVEDYKEFKSLQRENLRDHMTDLELILTMLGEATTTKITRDRDTKKLPGLKKDARDGGKVAGRTRKDIESQSGTKVVSRENYLKTPESVKRLNEKS
jgi:prophage antirepressor-like protein